MQAEQLLDTEYNLIDTWVLQHNNEVFYVQFYNILIRTLSAPCLIIKKEYLTMTIYYVEHCSSKLSKLVECHTQLVVVKRGQS